LLQTQCQATKKAESMTPHLLSLNQDIVAWSLEVKCGLKYVIHSLAVEFGFQIKTIKKAWPLLILPLLFPIV